MIRNFYHRQKRGKAWFRNFSSVRGLEQGFWVITLVSYQVKSRNIRFHRKAFISSFHKPGGYYLTKPRLTIKGLPRLLSLR